MELSIIVPVYNVEKYLDKCLNSLVKQTMKDYEIIIVNDGTKDNSQAIIDRYKKAYPDLIKAYIKENGGLSDARNFGLKYATGKYLAFIDSDDYAECDYYQNIYNLAKEDDLDLVVSDLEYVWENGEKLPMLKPGLNVDANKDISKALFLSPLFSWNKLYRRKLFTELDLKYPADIWYEDIPVTLKYFANAEKIGYYNHVGIHYLQRNTSILGSSYSPKMYDIFTVFSIVLKYFKDHNLFLKYRDELEYLYIEHFLVYGAFRFLRSDHYKELMPKAFEFVKSEFPQYRKNKYIKTFNLKNRLFLYSNNKETMSFWHWYLTK